MQIGRGNWYGKKYYFGMHYDLHATANDTELGTHCSPAKLVPMLKIMKPDFVQTDCKGHPGMTSWFTQVPDGTVSPGVVKDAMAQWREATKQLKLPLHCHYSGIWDMAAAKKHPEWTVVPAPGSDRKSEKMCPRSPYLEKLLMTVYNYPHIGNMRPVVVFDTLRRFLTYVGYDVTYVSNYTDVDDKIIKAAKQEGKSGKEL